MIKAILFDLGETLLTFGKVKVTGLFRQGARLSYDFLKSRGQPTGSFEGYFWRNLISLRFRHLISALTEHDFDSSALLRGISRNRGVKLDRMQWQEFAWLWYEPLSRQGKAEPDIRQTLAKLKASGLKLGIVSNTFVNGHSIERHLEQVGMLEFFPVRLYSYRFDFRKPNEQLFRIAAERIGESLEHIAYVGDRIDKDIIPAMRLGMTPILKAAYTNAGKVPPPGTWKITNVSELPDLIEKINDRVVIVTENV